MHDEQPLAEVEHTLAWRERLSLRLLRIFFVTFFLGAVVVWASLHAERARHSLGTLAIVWIALLAYPAITGRPGGAIRSWLLVVPGLTTALSGFALVGYLSGPAVMLTVTVMLSGLLLGHRTMIALTFLCAAVLTLIAWAMVTGRIPAPDPRDVAMTNPTDWTRSIVITFLGIGVFGSLMVAVVGRIERSLGRKRCVESAPSGRALRPKSWRSRGSSSRP
jgi:hypothetical protein